jgi:AcrR family transcriptional regulator
MNVPSGREVLPGGEAGEPSSGPTAVVPLRERNRARTRREIEAAALELMEQQGYQLTTVEQIARRAGISSATFFRYFSSKEEVLFADEEGAVQRMVALVAHRPDRALTLGALADPVGAFAESIVSESSSQAHKLTRLVMTTRDLEARSMRLRLRWEHGIARQLAQERGLDGPDLDQVLVANIAVSCLAAALWAWQRSESADVGDLSRAAFERAAALTSR